METNQERASRYVIEIRQALRMFGEYTYYDKGPSEVMDIPSEELKSLSPEDISETLQLVRSEFAEHADEFVHACIMSLDDWDKFDELLSKHEWLESFY